MPPWATVRLGAMDWQTKAILRLEVERDKYREALESVERLAWLSATIPAVERIHRIAQEALQRDKRP